MARVLFLTQVLPYPLDAGPKLRAYYVLRHLAQRHAVTLVSFVRAEDQPAHVKHLAQVCAAVHTIPMYRSTAATLRAGLVAVAQGSSLLVVRDQVKAMYATLAALLAAGSYDIVHADQTAMAQYALWAADHARGPRPRLVLDAHNALWKVVARLARQVTNPLKRFLLDQEAGRLRAYEQATYRHFDPVVFVTDVDRAEFALAGAQVIPICVEPAAPIARVPGAFRVTFVGALHWPPNAEGIGWFLDAVWPVVAAAVPGVTLTIIGKHPPAGLVAAAARAPRVTVTGYIDDLAPYLAQTAAFIVPLAAGGGMRVKIVDAWSWGAPVVSTSVGAEGLAYTAGEQLLLADTAEDFAAAVLHLLRDPAAGHRLAESGRRLVEEEYDWRRVYAAWNGVYHE